MNKQIGENQRIVAEERQHQSRPIIVPEKEVFHRMVTKVPISGGKADKSLYTSDGLLDWSWPHPIRINLRNMGNGPAFNLHCILCGAQDTCQQQFVSWDNGPIAEKSLEGIDLEHSSDLRLFHTDRIDGYHPLYDRTLNSPVNPSAYRIACLTITYHDLFGHKYMTIFQYTLQHRWIHVATAEIAGEFNRDLKELNDWKKQGR